MERDHRIDPTQEPQEVLIFEDPLKKLWNYHDHIVTNAPPRSVYWGLYRTREEADEWTATDPELTPQEFLDEGADVFMSWISTMKSAGISMEVALEAVRLKMNVVIDRVITADSRSRKEGISFDEAYKEAKELQD